MNNTHEIIVGELEEAIGGVIERAAAIDGMKVEDIGFTPPQMFAIADAINAIADELMKAIEQNMNGEEIRK